VLIRVLGAGAAGVLLSYAVVLLALWRSARAHPDAVGLRAAMRLLPDLLRLFRRLAGDRSLPRGVRLRLVLLLGYLVLPFALIPDVVPVLGYADDVIIVALVLRSVVRRAGPDAVRRHWPGSEEGLTLVLRLAGA
jgi:uncharacterized membrane protein YkvA (DUF1232 family)